MGTLDYQNRDDARHERQGRPPESPPTPADRWRPLANLVGGRFVAGRFGGSPSIIVPRGPWTVVLDAHAVVGGGRPPAFPYGRLRVRYLNRDGFRFSVGPAGILSTIGEWIGPRDLRVGDARFDEAFVVRGSDPAQFRRLFADPGLRGLVRTRPEADLAVRVGAGWMADPFPKGVSELWLTDAAFPATAGRLRGSLDLVVAVMDGLCRLGSAAVHEPPQGP